MSEFEGKVVVVTGGSRGIGRATCLAFAELGAKVVVASRKLDACEAVVREIEGNGGTAKAVACNISVLEDCANLIDAAVEKFGGVDVLVCNAAINPAMALVHDIKLDAANKTIQANVLGNMTLCQHAFPHMKAAGGGAIILISSVGGRVGAPYVAVYNMTKAAGEQLMRNLAVEWGRYGIRANGIAPGLIRTDLAKVFLDNEKLVREHLAKSPVQRLGEPEDIAGVAVFLASRAAAFITGQTIVVDGGGSVAAGN